ncbi:hypothetical protein BJ742DRAFT_778397 [Cladochytrium replicatum]|nr:hypothetical protein BJ742DRAFT_778397 [Cladochytrium replicatum]
MTGNYNLPQPSLKGELLKIRLNAETELEIANVSDNGIGIISAESIWKLSVAAEDILVSNDGNGADWTHADRTTTKDNDSHLFPFQIDL